MDGKMHDAGEREPQIGDSVVWSHRDQSHKRYLVKIYGAGPFAISDVQDVEYPEGGRIKFELRLDGLPLIWFDEELLAFA